MKEFAESLYKSKQWQHTRSAYLSSVGGLCENCLAKGIYKPAEIVHHKEHVTIQNVTNPEVTLSWNNFQALCRDCHGLQHSEKKNNRRRYKVDAGGEVIIR